MKFRTSNLMKVATLCLAALMATACSNGSSSEAPTAEEVNSETRATLNVTIWDQNQLPSLKQMLEGFAKKYPNIEVKPSVVDYDNYWVKLRTQAEGSNLPDVFWMNGPNVNLYASNGQLASLEPLTRNGSLDMGKYPEALTKLYSLDGKPYGVPKDFDTIGVWYNKALLAEAGVSEPTDAWTWADFSAAAEKAGKHFKSRGVHGVVTNIAGSGQTSYYNTVLQAGGSIIDGTTSGYDKPETIEGLTFWQNLIKNGGMPQTKAMSDPSPLDLFASGKAAMLWDGSWAAGPLKEKMGANFATVNVAALPTGKRKATVIHGLSWAISSKTKAMGPAQALVTYLGSQEAQLVDAQRGTAIPAYQGAHEQWLKLAPQVNLKSFITSANDYSFPYPVSKNTSAWNQLENQILVPAFDGGGSMDEAAKKLATQMNDQLAKEK